MKQQVDITLTLSLWLDATMDEDEIVTHVRSSLPKAFGEELTAMTNPVDILTIREEAAIYGEHTPQANELNAPWSLHFDREGTEAIAIIRDCEGADIVHSCHFGLADADDPIPATQAALQLMVAAPAMLTALEEASGTIEKLLDGDDYRIIDETGTELLLLGNLVDAALAEAARRAA